MFKFVYLKEFNSLFWILTFNSILVFGCLIAIDANANGIILINIKIIFIVIFKEMITDMFGINDLGEKTINPT